jgi:hypothetical protein
MCNCGLCTQNKVKRFARNSAARMWTELRMVGHVIDTESADSLNEFGVDRPLDAGPQILRG